MTRLDARGHASWPLIHRDPIHDQVKAALDARPFSAAMLIGPTGIGKSTLARQVLADYARSGRPVVNILALRELQDVPLGAFALALNGQGSAMRGNPAGQITDVIGSISARADAILFVDDAPLLDDLSAAAVYQLVRVHKLGCLMTARDEHPIAGAIQRLEHEGIVTRLSVAPMTSEEVDDLLRQRFGQPLDPESVRRFHRRSAGNPLVVRTLSEAAESQNKVHSTWHGLVLDEPRLPSHVTEIMSGQLAQLTPAERQAAQLVALAQPLPLPVIDGIAATEMLLASGFLVEVPGAPSNQVTVFHPLAAQLLIDEMASADRGVAAEEAAALLATSGDEQLRFRAVMLRARYDLDESAANLAWAAGFAVAVQDYRLAQQLAMQSIALEPAFDSYLALGTAESLLGESSATSTLELARAAAATDADRALATLRIGQHVAIRLGKPDEAVLLAESSLADLQTAAARGLLAAELIKWRSMAGDALPSNPGRAELTGHHEDSSPDHPESADSRMAKLNGLIHEAMVCSMIGDPSATSSAVSAARPLADEFRAQLPFAEDLLDLNEFLALVFDGELREAETFASTRHSTQRADARGQWHYTESLLALHTGRVVDALSSARRATIELERRDFTGLIGAARALQATALAQLGRDVESRKFLQSLNSSQHLDAKVVLQAAEAEASLLVRSGDVDAGSRVILAAVDVGMAKNHLALSALSLYSVVRFGQAALITEPLSNLADMTNSRLIRTMRDHVDAEISGSALLMNDTARELEAVGLVAGARDLWRAAARAYHRLGKSERARACLMESERCGRGLLLLDTMKYRVDLSGGLTARELQVAKAAATRQRSAEIAASLGLSVRTVDNHLQRVYRKLGVSSRIELQRALEEFAE